MKEVEEVEALHKRILVQRYEPETMASEETGLVKPDIAVTQNSWGKVIKTGPDVTAVHAGDSVIISLYGGTEVTLDKEPYIIIDESELLLRLPGDNAGDTAQS
jgi:co-chaperonin GroES (HSP10)